MSKRPCPKENPEGGPPAKVPTLELEEIHVAPVILAEVAGPGEAAGDLQPVDHDTIDVEPREIAEVAGSGEAADDLQPVEYVTVDVEPREIAEVAGPGEAADDLQSVEHVTVDVEPREIAEVAGPGEAADDLQSVEHVTVDVEPREIAEVTYPSGAVVNLGNKLTPQQAMGVPTIKWEADDNSYYTVCMTGPDVTSREDPQPSEWRHWLVCNIRGGDVSNGETVSPYDGPSPPRGTGLHRYVFRVYKQKGKIVMKTSEENRGGFSTRRFAAQENLGQPVAHNFFMAEWARSQERCIIQ